MTAFMRTTKGLALAALTSALILLTGCSAEEETVLPTAVLEQEDISVFGLTEEAQRIVRKSVELGKAGFQETGNLNLGSDYLNIRDGEVTFTETWAGSWGVNAMHMVTVWPSETRLVFSSKDRNAICWYAELVIQGGEPVERFGMSVDASCRASDVDQAKTTWEKATFPLSPVTSGSTDSNGTGSSTASKIRKSDIPSQPIK